MSEFEYEKCEDGDVLIRHVRQGHEYILDRCAQGMLVLSRAVRGRAAIDHPDDYAAEALAFAGRTAARL